jgi:hypothetical protein
MYDTIKAYQMKIVFSFYRATLTVRKMYNESTIVIT